MSLSLMVITHTRLILSALLMLVLSACSNNAAPSASTPAPSPTTAPTATLVPPTPTALPSATPVPPTVTPFPATATALPPTPAPTVRTTVSGNAFNPATTTIRLEPV